MSAQCEFIKWLNRTEKTFQENLQFAAKAWISAEFLLNNKYDVVIKWFCTKVEEDAKKLKKNLPYAELQQLLSLPAQPGSIAAESKAKFVELLLGLIAVNGKQISSNYKEENVKLLRRLLEVEWLQDVLRTDYELTASVYGRLFECYKLYLNDKIENKQLLLAAHETDYFNSILKLLKDYIKRIGDTKALETAYDSHIVGPLIAIMLNMRQECEIDFFEELHAIEALLRQERSPESLVNHLLGLRPLHVRTFALECAVATWLKDNAFMESLLHGVFRILDRDDDASAETLMFCAFLFDILRKHNASVNFTMMKPENEKATCWMGTQLFACVEKFRPTHLRGILHLLNATLRMNPLILEQHIFEIMTSLMVAQKDESTFDENSECGLLETFLLLVLDMFRRLSRSEKFVANVLKSVRQCLLTNQLPKLHPKKASKEMKHKLTASDEATPSKRRKLAQFVASIADEDCSEVDSGYLEQYFKRFYHASSGEHEKERAAPSCSALQSFPYLYSSWPWTKVGKAFSRLITGLVTKPSLVIWKSLLYALKDLLDSLLPGDAGEPEQEANDKVLFQLDLTGAMFCQYFAGLKVPDQYEKHAESLLELRNLTVTVLKTFGQWVLSRDFDQRTTNAFLECSYYFSMFELLLAYYKPDGTSDTNLEGANLVQQLHGFLTKREWQKLEKSIAAAGKPNSNFLYKRLLLQRQEAAVLLVSAKEEQDSVEISSQPSAFSHEDIKQLLLEGYRPNAVWLLKSLDRPTRHSFIKEIFDAPCVAGIDHNLLKPIAEDLESLELAAFTLLENISQALKANAKASLYALLDCDFERLQHCQADDHAVYDGFIKSLAKVIDENVPSVKTKKLPKDEIAASIETLAQLPLGSLRRQTKSVAFALLLALYHDLNSCKANELSERVFEIAIDLLYFGQNIPVFKYFNTNVILRILPVEPCWPFYELLFSFIKNEDKANEKFLATLSEHLRLHLEEGGKISESNLRLLLIALETLSALSGPYGKRMLKYLYSMMDIFSQLVKGYFGNVQQLKGLNEKEFVERTLRGFASYALFLLNSHKKEMKKAKTKTTNNEENEEQQTKETESDQTKSKQNESEEQHTKENENELNIKGLGCVDEDFRKICKIYLGHSINYRNQHAIRLMQVALNHRELLHLDQDEIELVLSVYWRQLNEDLRGTQESDKAVQLIGAKTTESVVKMIIGNKTNEDLLLTLKDINHLLHDAKNFPFVLSLLNLITKSAFSTIKGAIFNEQFRLITCNIAMLLTRNEQQQFSDVNAVLGLLSCQQAFVENKTIPFSPDTLDNIIEFLAAINIKKFQLDDTNGKLFFRLHSAMTQLCSALIKHWHVLLMDRVAQFMHIFKDLLQAVVHYKSDRQKETGLSATELEDLADLGLKLEVLMHVIAKHGVDMKRIAPFVLTFAINLMVANKRSTTLYPKIKSHVEAICHGLIGICDHRAGRFILRCSNEAARQSYELLVKDHKKYHKFKGKI